MFLSKKLSFAAGLVCGLSFAPIFLTPGILMLSVICRQVAFSETRKQAMMFGYLFGFGFFLSTLYWICFGVSVYIDEFWWAIPFALFGLPAFLALFVASSTLISWHLRKSWFYHFFFCISWLFFEWLVSWIFTGLPWGVIGYAFSVSDILIQSSSVYGIFGLSFAAIYIGSSFYSKENIKLRLVMLIIMCVGLVTYGYQRLENNQTEFSKVKVRIVQPSIQQIAKWDVNAFWNNLDKQVEMSRREGDPDIIVWSEAALTAPYYYKPVHDSLMSVFTKEGQVLLAGGINDNSKQGDDYEIYSALIAMQCDGKLLFDYHKSHLVPFGEYMPLGKYIPIKKLTHGFVDYTEGSMELVRLESYNLSIKPLVCYESIFPEEVRVSNEDVDIMINVTNDAWYGNSSGPYQHFEISRMRSVENGLPMIRAANNGISAIIDPLGRVLSQLDLNEVDILDGFMPLKLSLPTIYSENGDLALAIWVLFVLILQLLIAIALRGCNR